MYASAADKHVGTVVKIFRKMYERPSVGRSVCRLESGHFES